MLCLLPGSSSEARDGEIVNKDATRELVKLISSRLGLELPKMLSFRSCARSRSDMS